ncbi:hypothetical protein [Lacticaseibacillus saniviri]
MGKVIPLPDQVKRHIQVGQQALAAKDYASAVAHLEKAYTTDQTFDTAVLLVRALNGMQMASEALPVISHFMHQFMATPEHQQELLTTLLAVPDYSSAWALSHHLDDANQAAFRQRIAEAEDHDMTSNKADIEALRKQVQHMGGRAFHEQEQLVSELGRLPKPVLRSALPPLLVDDDVHPAIKVSVLETLTAIDVDQALPMTTYLGEQQVVPATLPGVMNDPTIVNLLQTAQTQYPDQDAEIEMLRLSLGFLYPIVDQVIPDPEEFLTRYFGDRDQASAKQKALLDWLTQQISALMDFA